MYAVVSYPVESTEIPSWPPHWERCRVMVYEPVKVRDPRRFEARTYKTLYAARMAALNQWHNHTNSYTGAHYSSRAPLRTVGVDQYGRHVFI